MPVNVPDTLDHNSLANAVAVQELRIAQLENDRTVIADEVLSHDAELVDIVARISKLEQTPPPPPPPPPIDPPPPPTGTLLQKSNLVYQGAFRLPASGSGDNWRETSFKNANALSYDATTDSLFVGGHETQGRLGQVKVPEVRNTGYSGLAVATVMQVPAPVMARMPIGAFNSPAWVLGSLPVGNDIIIAAVEQYDSDRSGVRSHGRIAGKALASGAASGFFQVGSFGGGIVGGYMGTVPPEWQSRLGCKYLTGIAGLSISSRASQGPAALGFDPAQLGTTPAPTVNLLYYPYFGGSVPPAPPDFPLSNPHQANTLWTANDTVRGVVFADGTDSVLFFGCHGSGPVWYGTPGVEGTDPAYPDKGYHSYPYHYYVWAYDAKDLEKVRDGTLKAWEVRPYVVWSFDLPLNSSTRLIGGAAWDAAGRRIFVSARMSAPDGDATVHVFKVQ